MVENLAIKSRAGATIARVGDNVVIFMRPADQYEAMRLFDECRRCATTGEILSVALPSVTFQEIEDFDAAVEAAALALKPKRTPWQIAKAIFWGDW